MPLHLVFDEKFDAQGAFIKLKGRLVIGGNLQDCSGVLEVSSATVRINTIFLVLNVAAFLDLHVAAIDVKAAYVSFLAEVCAQRWFYTFHCT
jgi:hypothetical protein